MSELDDLLMRLRDVPPPAGLAQLGPGVMAGLDHRREMQASRRGLALAGSIAIIVGVVSALAPRPPAEAKPLLEVPEAAPSHLLVG